VTRVIALPRALAGKTCAVTIARETRWDSPSEGLNQHSAPGQIETSGLIESKPESGRSFHLGEISVAARASRAALNAVRINSVTICRIRIRRFVVYTKPRDERRG
jgi:hypothetical protein